MDNIMLLFNTKRKNIARWLNPVLSLAIILPNEDMNFRNSYLICYDIDDCI